MKTYELNISHSSGTKTVMVRAEDISDAKYRVCQSENYLASVVTWWRVVPTQKQVSRTQSLMRGL